jgi:hypothetical protein
MTISTYDLEELIDRGQYYLSIEKELDPLLGKDSLTIAERLHYKNMIYLRDGYEKMILRLCKQIVGA